jgi:Ca2+-binding EF-hand superfamily protein
VAVAVATVSTAAESDYVREARSELRGQLKTVQAKLALLDLLAAMTDEHKLDLLFGLVDVDRSGMVDAHELAVMLRSRNRELTGGDGGGGHGQGVRRGRER